VGRRVAFDVRNRGNVVTVRAGSKSRLTAAFVSTPLHLWLAVLVVLALGTSGTVYARFRRRRRSPVPVRAANAVGDSACLSCHTAKSTFEQTAHRRTMSRPSRESIEGSFRPGENILRAEHSDVHFRMDADSAGFYESLVSNGDTTLRRERIAIVGGSGRKGQSFLYWSGDRLFQLPVSYYTELHRWIGSPGRAGIDPRASFNRAVAPRCFECHATWIESVPDLTTNNRYVDAGAILGITCERCHASGA